MESKLLNNKKGQIREKINTVITIIISVVVLFAIFAGLVPEAQTAGDEFSDETKCGEAGCFFNSTLSPTCVINSSQTGTGACTNAVETIPIASVFGSQGIIILLLMVFLFIGIIRIVMPKSRK